MLDANRTKLLHDVTLKTKGENKKDKAHEGALCLLIMKGLKPN